MEYKNDAEVISILDIGATDGILPYDISDFPNGPKADTDLSSPCNGVPHATGNLAWMK